MVERLVLAVVAASIGAGCGGGHTPTSPSPPGSTPPPGSACGAISGTRSLIAPSILNGSTCSTATSSVVLVNLRDKDGQPTGSCSGTVITPRAVLTAAHCLVGDTAAVRIFPGIGNEVPADSFQAYPQFSSDRSAPDIGVVITTQDVGRTPIPLLVSRDSRVGEQAVIAGWGKDALGNGTTLRAGTTTISMVDTVQLETQTSSTSSSVCQGDSGGPLLISEGGVWAIAGVTSAVTVSGSCTAGTNFYTNMRHPGAMSFVFGLAPNASRQ